MFFLFNPQQRCWYSDSPFTKEGILFYTAGSRNGLEGGLPAVATHTQIEVDPTKIHVFVRETY